MQPDIEIARQASTLPIEQIAEKLNIPNQHLYRYGSDKAKVDLDYLATLDDRPDGKLILVTAITPTPAGEGKTTTTVGLGDAMNRIGKNTAICLREPSLGPCFGTKGGAAGGGFAQIVPMEDINLHFTGDFHAIGAANNLLAAMLDNHIYWGNKLNIDARRISWRRVVDMNDRALRSIVVNLGGVANGFPRQDGFDITVASEVMAVFCLATDSDDLRRRLGNIVVAQNTKREVVTARQLDADGAMAALLKDAIQPNLAQTLENNPAFVHGGPFANIAHGCNSVIATKAALKMADFVVTEAGFGADLGAEKFLDIKCRKAGLRPDAVVLVATVRALKMHGGVGKDDLTKENVKAVEQGLENLGKHLENLAKYGVRAVVAINQFTADTEAEMAVIRDYCQGFGVDAYVCSHWADGGAGAEDLAKKVAEIAQSGVSDFHTLYEDEMPLWDKMRTVAQEIYGAEDISGDRLVTERFKQLQDQGYGHLPICVAKTQYSFSTDPNRKGAPKGHVVSIREVRLAAGAEFLVVVCGDIMTMPGLPSRPAAEQIGLDENGQITGLF
ncbi:MAG: formate--tetrahydrofolate ligase [Rhodospirillaceae bacterium]|jgi:formate--tetrahydrofolate ligase|nr:formate--tetrahydrofolate ligase [Rhodospirillaceae bacterium]MBT4043109.1 formate--tetrahydrofolate ligase [Rhodospirillaceae bacterium]MBT4688107.1 formate--tetrahydrofolate ligase [Rhodospirillaceae bacterium]MBT5080274.1 formate--tetrahydrofolate ligase [Rhodospirillaceae bacterium]MBT5525027.1 formate--tetrahydrofolate ligase [Rhodospirillaceae bacterium]